MLSSSKIARSTPVPLATTPAPMLRNSRLSGSCKVKRITASAMFAVNTGMSKVVPVAIKSIRPYCSLVSRLVYSGTSRKDNTFCPKEPMVNSRKFRESASYFFPMVSPTFRTNPVIFS